MTLVSVFLFFVSNVLFECSSELAIVWCHFLSREFCQFESFNATCSSADEVILIEEARYGRLQLGRCVTRDYGYIGCSANVIDLVDRVCSGRTSCHVSVPALRDLVQPCPKDLTSYLEISYRCVKVFNAQSRCNSTVQLNTGPDAAVYLNLVVNGQQSSSDGVATDNPTRACPATFRVRPGQHIAVTLYSFLQHSASGGLLVDGVKSSSSAAGTMAAAALAADGPTLCQTNTGSLVVVDDSGWKVDQQKQQQKGARPWSVRLCDVKHQHRQQTLVTTNSSTAAIYYVDDDYVGGGGGGGGGGGRSGEEKSARTAAPVDAAGGGTIGSEVSMRRLKQMIATGWRFPIVYLVKIEAIGCANLEPPANARVDRYDDSLVVRCNLSQETWYLTCKGTDWIGTISNCSDVTVTHNEEVGFNSAIKKKTMPFGLWMAVVIGICLGVFFGFIMLIVVFIYKRCRTMRTPPKMNVLLGPCDDILSGGGGGGGGSTHQLQSADMTPGTSLNSSTIYCPRHLLQQYRQNNDTEYNYSAATSCPARHLPHHGGGRILQQQQQQQTRSTVYADLASSSSTAASDYLPRSMMTYVMTSPSQSTSGTTTDDPPPLPPPDMFSSTSMLYSARHQQPVDAHPSSSSPGTFPSSDSAVTLPLRRGVTANQQAGTTGGGTTTVVASEGDEDDDDDEGSRGAGVEPTSAAVNRATTTMTLPRGRHDKPDLVRADHFGRPLPWVRPEHYQTRKQSPQVVSSGGENSTVTFRNWHDSNTMLDI